MSESQYNTLASSLAAAVPSESSIDALEALANCIPYAQCNEAGFKGWRAVNNAAHRVLEVWFQALSDTPPADRAALQGETLTITRGQLGEVLNALAVCSHEIVEMRTLVDKLANPGKR